MVGAQTSMTKPEGPEYVPRWALLIAAVAMPLLAVSGFLAALIGSAAPYEPTGVLLLVVGLLFTVGGPMACGAFLDRLTQRDGHPRCPRCKYDLRHLPEPRCPECGQGN